jgi:hypothetical protein
MSAELATVTEQGPEPTTGHLIALALKSGMSGDQITALVELKRQEQRDRAADAFAAAVTKFQSLCPIIKKERQPTGSPIKFDYASLDDIMRQIRPILHECNLVPKFTSKPNEYGLEVTCTIRHGTHTEETSLTVPVDPHMKVNDTQRVGSALSYGKRYALCAALNIVVSDEDDDAASAGQCITEEECVQIRNLLAEKNKNEGAFLTWVQQFQPGCESVEGIAAVNLAKIMDAINRGGKKR